jgi:hypothetical protein
VQTVPRFTVFCLHVSCLKNAIIEKKTGQLAFVYGCETWYVIPQSEHRSIGNSVLRRIFRLTRERERGWRKLRNEIKDDGMGKVRSTHWGDVKRVQNSRRKRSRRKAA